MCVGSAVVAGVAEVRGTYAEFNQHISIVQQLVFSATYKLELRLAITNNYVVQPCCSVCMM